MSRKRSSNQQQYGQQYGQQPFGQAQQAFGQQPYGAMGGVGTSTPVRVERKGDTITVPRRMPLYAAVQILQAHAQAEAQGFTTTLPQGGQQSQGQGQQGGGSGSSSVLKNQIRQLVQQEIQQALSGGGGSGQTW